MNKKLMSIAISFLIVGMIIAPVSAVVTPPTSIKDALFKGIWVAIMDLQKQITDLTTKVNTIQLKPGPMGPPGPAGTPGPAGATGPQGLPGEKGDKGDTGAVGPQGPIGPAGTSGGTGDKGPVGDKGPTGDQGPPGIQGIAGASGVQGPPGIQGIAGAAGVQGPPGATGPSAVSGWVKVLNSDGGMEDTREVTVNCPTGKKILGGGAGTGEPKAIILSSYPIDDSQWWAQAYRTSGTGYWTLYGYAICANVAS